MNTQHKANGVHHVGLARPIGPNNAREVFEGTQDLFPCIGLEIVHLQAVNAPHGWKIGALSLSLRGFSKLVGKLRAGLSVAVVKRV